MRDIKQPEEEQRFTLLTEHQGTQKLVRFVALALIAWGFVQGVSELIIRGASQPPTLYVSSLAIIVGSLCLYLIRLDRVSVVNWVLLWGIWGIVFYAALFRDGMTAPGIVILPVLITLSLLLTSSNRGALSLTVASIAALLLVELSSIYGWFEYEGIKTPFIRATTIIAILIISYYLTYSLVARFREQKRLTEELKLVTENSPMMLAVIADKGAYLFVNSEYAGFYGKTSAGLIGSSVEDLEGEGILAGYLHAAQKASGERHYESRRVDALGQIHWFEVIASPIEDFGDNKLHIMLRNISEEKKAKQHLAESELEYQNIIETSIDPYFRIDLKGRIILVSPSIEQFAGYSTADLAGKDLADFYLSPGRLDDFLIELREHGVVRNFDAQLKTKDGGSVWVSSNAQFWKDATGNLLGVEGFVRNIQQWREMHVELQKTQKMQALNHLTGGVAHEFNNLMAIILGSIDLIQPLLKDNELVNKKIATIEQAASQGAELTSKLQAFSKTKSSELQTMDINDEIREILPILVSALTSEIQIELELADGLWHVDMPRGEFKEAVINLVINARHAMDGNGRLGISTCNLKIANSYQARNLLCQPGDYVVLTVSDTGVGIAEDIIDKIMDPFFTTKNKATSSGLGLSMVYGLVQRVHGDVKVESKPGEGAKFSVYLPKSKTRNQKETANANEELPLGNREKILFAEDEPSLREVGMLRLKQLNYEVIVAENGVRAREILESKQPVDLVFSDVVMPGGVNGFELVKITRTLRPGIGILLCSGYALDENQAGLALEEIPQILQKPFSLLVLAKALQDTLKTGDTNKVID